MHRFTFVSLPAGRLARAAPVAAGLALATALALAAAVPALAAVGATAARTTIPGGTWGSASEVPGLAALNAGGNAQISSMSCASVGNCGAGGSYTDSADQHQA